MTSDSTSLKRVEPTNVLIIDDEEPLLLAYERILSSRGYNVITAKNGTEALAIVGKASLDVVVSDIRLPDTTGTELLREIRNRDPDLPVILITGSPTIESAANAVELGALRYLLKPVSAETLIDAVGIAAKLRRISRLQTQSQQASSPSPWGAQGREGIDSQLDRGLSQMWIAYHPIVCFSDRTISGYEALLRTREPSIPHPGVFLSIAERLDRLTDVGRAIREAIARSMSIGDQSKDIYINLHAQDLDDEMLYADDGVLLSYAHRIVLEITERAAIKEGATAVDRVKRLKRLGFRIAIDDLGAGYAGLNYLAMLSPDVVKLDMTLVRNLHTDSVRRKLVESMCVLCNDLDMKIIAEGVETVEEQDVLVSLGCDLLQGFFYARPGPPFPNVTWGSGE